MMGVVGTVELAAHGIAMQVTAIGFMVHVGLSNAATVRTGRFAGAGDWPNLRRGGVMAIAISAVVGVLQMVLYLTLPEQIIGLFIDRSSVEAVHILTFGGLFLALAAAFQMMDAGQVLALWPAARRAGYAGADAAGGRVLLGDRDPGGLASGLPAGVERRGAMDRSGDRACLCRIRADVAVLEPGAQRPGGRQDAGRKGDQRRDFFNLDIATIQIFDLLPAETAAKACGAGGGSGFQPDRLMVTKQLCLSQRNQAGADPAPLMAGAEKGRKQRAFLDIDHRKADDLACLP